MKQAKKPTRYQKEIIRSNDLNEKNYAIVKESEFYLTIMNKITGKVMRIDNFIKRRSKR